MAKKVNNPDGKKGGDKHQKVVNEQVKILRNEFSDDGITVRSEVVVSTPNGKKAFRFADIAAFRFINSVLEYLKIIQVGNTDKNGKPVKREQEAIADIEAHTNLKVTFVDYKSKKI